MEIYIEDKDKLDASVAANAFTTENTRNRVYINTLGAELAIKYLASENIDVSNIHNIHSIKKIIEDTDISDIMLKNIHLDIRVIFDENIIFIPKSHFEYNIVPDIYLVFKPSQDFSYSEFLGFFEPKLINKNNANSDYYFIEKEKLSSPFDLKNFVENFKGNTDEKLSEDEMNKCEQIIVSISDHETCDKKYLLEKLTKSAELREKFIEYENFETLSYKTMTDTSVIKKEINNMEETIDSFDFENDLTDIADTEEPIEDILEDALIEEDAVDNDEIESIDNIEELETFEQTENIDDIDDIEEAQDVETNFEELEELEEIDEPLEQTEVFSEDEVMSFENFENPSENIEQLEEEPLMSLDEEIIEAEVLPDESYKELESIENLSDNLIEEEISTNETIVEDVLEPSSEILPEPEEILETSVENFEKLEEEVISESDEEVFDVAEEFPQEILSEKPENNESFGNNLLENLQSEAMDRVSIETFEDNTEDISSDDLLSEIDNILTDIPNKASIEEDCTKEEFTQGIEQEVLSPNEESLDDIPDISDLTSDIIPSNDVPEEDETVFAEQAENDNYNMDNLMEENNSDDELEVLYDEEQPQPELPQEEPAVPGAALYNKQSANNKKTLIIAAALIAVLAGGALTMLKNRSGDENFDITPETSAEKPLDDNMLGINTPDIEKTETTKEVTKQPVKELKNTVAENTTTPQAYMSINRLVWDVPDSLSYSKGIQSYLRTAGKSIKLSLSADLLLATEFAYTNNVKVGLKISNNGSVQEAKILSGSGSTQIDSIVLQSVKDTLKVVKPPSGEVKTPDFNLNLIIYF